MQTKENYCHPFVCISFCVFVALLSKCKGKDIKKVASRFICDFRRFFMKQAAAWYSRI